MIARVFAIAAAGLAFAERASACAVCFGDPESDQTRALMVAMGVLLGIVASILGIIVVTGFRIARRSAQVEAVGQPEDTGIEGAGS